jgi:hypothetical protein
LVSGNIGTMPESHLPLEILERELIRLTAELREVDKRRNALLATVNGLRQAINGFRAMNPPDRQTRLPLGTTNGARPDSYTDGLRRILTDSPGRKTWRLTELLAEMNQRQWMAETNKHPLETLRVAANTLVEKGALRKAGPGVYAPVRPAVAEAPTNGSGGDG